MVDDHPTVAALHALLTKVLQLPAKFSSAAQRAQWLAFQRMLPPLPMITEHGVLSVSPYASYPANANVHNDETAELYSTHPYRLLTAARHQYGDGADLAPALNCLKQGASVRVTCGFAMGITTAGTKG